MEAGFDYVESGLAALAAAHDLSVYRDVPLEATNLFFPHSIRLFGVERTPYLDYAREALERAAMVGVQISVVGSGGVRRAPEDGDLQEYDEEFADIAAELADIAEEFGITLAPESLNRSETNVGNDLASLARRLADRNVAYTADSYHVLYEWNAENPGRSAPGDEVWTVQVPFRPAHVHVATLPRVVPAPDDPKLLGFVSRLRTLGYDQRVSLECQRGSSSDELRSALGSLKSLFGS